MFGRELCATCRSSIESFEPSWRLHNVWQSTFSLGQSSVHLAEAPTPPPEMSGSSSGIVPTPASSAGFLSQGGGYSVDHIQPWLKLWATCRSSTRFLGHAGHSTMFAEHIQPCSAESFEPSWRLHDVRRSTFSLGRSSVLPAKALPRVLSQAGDLTMFGGAHSALVEAQCYPRASTKAECVPPNFEPKIAGVGTILELEPDIFSGGGGASARGRASTKTEFSSLAKKSGGSFASSLGQKSRWSFGKWHRASTKAECALPNIMESPAWLKTLEWHKASTEAECALPNTVESPDWLKTLGGASHGSKILAELRRVARASINTESAPPNLVELPAWPKNSAELRRVAQSFDQGYICSAEYCGVSSLAQISVSSLGQKSRRSFSEWHRALAKAECALPNIVESPAWLKNLSGASAGCTELQPSLKVLCREHCGVSSGLKNLGEASASHTKLGPRLNVLRQTLWSLQHGSKISVELHSTEILSHAGDSTMFVGAYSALVKALCFSQKLQHLRQRCLAQVPELYPLQHLWLMQSPAWLKNVREALSPAWVKNLGRASMRSTELWPRLNVLCRILWSLQHGPKIRRSLAWLKTLGGASAGGTELPPRLNVLRRTLWSLQLGSKVW
ncbi:hypothetical protein C8J57DRAFT_1251762 [Mycena rebaudengoi]|nr:hypothetical protein C8J57DRAFT_1251762 [Mycena rebaudengoi]